MTSRAKQCPFCHSNETEKQADFSTSLMVSLYYCRRCRSSFEAIKWGDRTVELDVPRFLEERPS
ncbi:MAG: hypothetical protein JSW43_08720 [Gemmatimonadota bacterium]|nr:MAG: hypothetical protein JSW43_08720 [Gemmatimonadota bacterium]